MKLRTGVVRYHNKALTSMMVLTLDEILEKEWHGSTLLEHREAIEEFISFVLISLEQGYEERRYPWCC